MFSDILGKLVYPASEMSQACKKPAGPSAFSGRLFTVMLLPALLILVLGLSDTRKAIALTPTKDADAPKQPDTKI